MRLIFKYIIFSNILLLSLGQIACPDLRVAASLAAKKARDDKAEEEKKAREAAEEEEKRKMLQPPADVTNHVLQRISNGITLTWINPIDADFSKVLILKSESSIVDAPTTGRDYAGVNFLGSSQMMYNAASSSFTDTEITEGVTYFYKIFAYDTNFNYASGVELKGDTTSPKNVTNSRFVNFDSNGTTLAWANPTDADFSKVLILKNTSSIADAPATGRDYASGDSIGSSQVVYNATASNFADTQITGGLVAYFYKLFAYDASFNYASGAEISGGGSKADRDGDGLIEIYTAEMLNNMRYDLTGASYKSSVQPATGTAAGCPTSSCNGYELTAHIDLLSLLDKNGNGMIDTTTVGIDKNADGDTTDAGERITVIDIGMGKDKSWVPIGDNSTNDDTSRFTGNFEGNNHTIANLWVNVSSSGRAYASLFGVTDGTVVIRNVGVISGSIRSSSTNTGNSYSGGLVARSEPGALTITNSYFSGPGGVFAITTGSGGGSSSGGLVGNFNSSVIIINSTFSGSGGVYAFSTISATLGSTSGGLVGYAGGPLTIMKSYFSGSGEISAIINNTSRNTNSGGLVGASGDTVVITDSYFGGSGVISSSIGSGSSSYSGSLVGNSTSSLTVTNSYWNTDAPQSVNGSAQNPKRAEGNAAMNPSGATGLTFTQLMGVSGIYPNGLPNGATDNTKAWDLGTNTQLPAIKLCIPTVTSGVTDWATCASYGDLLAGQR